MTAAIEATLAKLRKSELHVEYDVSVKELAGFDLENAVKRERRARSNYTRTVRRIEKEERSVAGERHRQALCDNEGIDVFRSERDELWQRAYSVWYDRSEGVLARRLGQLADAAHELEHAKAVVEAISR